MCGICGFTGHSDSKILSDMTQALFHRGPDEDGTYEGDGINLGMRRLSIIDVEGGHQPVSNEDGTVCVVFNGEIYNHEELRKELLKSKHVFVTDHSDTEVIVHLYEEYGLEFVHKLNGMFAIAIWDSNTDSLHLIRDRMGVKPLFYSLKDDKLIFASEIKSILRHPDYTRKISYKGIAYFFNLKHVPAPFTAFEGISSLLPGQLLSFSKGELSTRKYWKLNFDENKSFLDDEDAVIDKIYEILVDATRIRMRSDVPVGAYLSGGVDSSSIVALMSGISSAGNIKTFSMGYADEIKSKHDDVYFAKKVSEMYDTDHYQFTMTCDAFKEDVLDVVRAFDQPFGGVTSTFFLTKLISKHVKVALSGDGADELFGSYLSHRLAPAIQYLAADEVNDLSWGEDPRTSLFSDNREFVERLYSGSQGDGALWRNMILPFAGGGKESLFTDVFGETERSDELTTSYLRDRFADTTSCEALNSMLEMELSSFFPDQVLAFVDVLSMAHSVEVRSPFIDYRLVEFMATVPSELKIKGDIVKYILKKCIDKHGILPEGITQRPKEGFVLPVYRWMDGPLRGWVEEILSRKKIDRGGLLRYDLIKNILDEHYSGTKKKYAEIWNLVMFQLWWDEYFGEVE